MAGLTKTIPRFLYSGRSSQNGLAGLMQRLIGGQGIKGSGIIGTAVIANGQTTVTVTDAAVQTTDIFIGCVMTKGSNVSAFSGVSTIVANTSYVVNVTADPGAAGCTVLIIRLPAQLLFSS